MALRNKFLHFKTKASYFAEKDKQAKISEDALKQFNAYTAFVDEGPTIYVFEKEYKCDISGSEVDEKIKKRELALANALSFEKRRAQKREDEIEALISNTTTLTRSIDNNLIKYDYDTTTLSINFGVSYTPNYYIDVEESLEIIIEDSPIHGSTASVLVYGDRNVSIIGNNVIKNLDSSDSNEYLYRLYSFNCIGDRIAVTCTKFM